MRSSKHSLPARAERVLGFLVAKGFLRSDQIRPQPSAKLLVRDVFWVGANVEPRVLEVFPAAFIHFPRAFVGNHDTPDAMRAIVEAIRRGEESGDTYEGLAFRDMARWANVQPSDRRAKPLRDQKKNKTLRLHPNVIRTLAALATERGRSETQIVEDLVLRESSLLPK